MDEVLYKTIGEIFTKMKEAKSKKSMEKWKNVLRGAVMAYRELGLITPKEAHQIIERGDFLVP